MYPRKRSVERKYALSQCMKFFRDELYFGAHTERLDARYRELRELCAKALGDPSVRDVDEIDRQFREMQACHG